MAHNTQLPLDLTHCHLSFLDVLEEEGDVVLDLGFIDDPVEDVFDMNGPFSLLNRLNMNISVAHEVDGLYDEVVTEPHIGIEKAGLILYVLTTSGMFHRVRVHADEDGDYYHLRFVEATMVYEGQES